MKGCQILEGVLQCGGKQKVSIREDLNQGWPQHVVVPAYKRGGVQCTTGLGCGYLAEELRTMVLSDDRAHPSNSRPHLTTFHAHIRIDSSCAQACGFPGLYPKRRSPKRREVENVVGKCWECINFTKTPANMSLPTCNPGSLMLQTCTAHLGHDVGQML